MDTSKHYTMMMRLRSYVIAGHHLSDQLAKAADMLEAAVMAVESMAIGVVRPYDNNAIMHAIVVVEQAMAKMDQCYHVASMMLAEVANTWETATGIWRMTFSIKGYPL